MDWALFDNYIKSKNINRSYRATLKTLINFLKRIDLHFKELTDAQILEEYEAKTQYFDDKIKEMLIAKGKETGIISNFHSGITHLKAMYNTRLTTQEISENFEIIKSTSDLLKKIKENEEELVNALNKIDKKIVNKQIEYYNSRKNPEKIVKIRFLILQILAKGDISLKQLESIKLNVSAENDKNILQAWKNFGICYPLIYFESRDKIIDFLEKFSSQVIQDLSLSTSVNKAVYGFDGPQNQGMTEVWFAIYNKSYKTQKDCKQIYFSIGGGWNEEAIAYGAFEFKSKERQINTKDLKDFNYLEMIEYLKKFVNTIMEDESKTNSETVQIKKESVLLIENKKQIILFGPPGTGKTYSTKSLALAIIKNGS